MKDQSKIVTLNNGLTTKQVEAARATLAKVNQTKVCEKAGVKVATINNVLRDTSDRVADLKKVLVIANREIQKKQRTLKSLPV